MIDKEKKIIDFYVNELFQSGQITLEEYLKTQELPSVTIARIRKAMEEKK